MAAPHAFHGFPVARTRFAMERSARSRFHTLSAPEQTMAAESRPVGIRPTTEDDWAILKAIRLAALLDSPTAFGLSHAIAVAYSEQQWRDRASPRTQPQFLIATDPDGQAIGMIGDTINAAGEYNLIAMWVHPGSRGMGIAGRLVNAIQTRALERGHRRVVLSVSPDNVQAVDLYRRHGFTFLPEWEPLTSQPGVSAQKMAWTSKR
jgi:ribosomal protein S18 acetylase RimI-like enzyme